MKPFASLSKRSVDPDCPGFIGGISGRLIRLFRLTPYALLLALLLAPASFVPQSFAEWGPDVRISNAPGYSHTSLSHAWCVGANKDTVHVVWFDRRDGINDKIYYRRSTDAGQTWGPETRLTTDPECSAYPSIAVSGSNVHVVWHDSRDGTGLYEIYYKHSTDGGSTWSSDTRLSDLPYLSYYPSATVSGLNVHVVWCDTRDGGYEIYYKRSTDGGSTWGPDIPLTDNPINNPMGNPSVAVSGLNVHVAWYGQEGMSYPEVYYKRSTDRGSTWGPETRLTFDPEYSGWPSIAASGSDVHVVWDDTRNPPGIYYKRSTDYGVSWGPDTRICESEVGRYPSVVASFSNVHMVWVDSRDGNPEIYYKGSTNDGSTWESDTRLTYNLSYADRPSIAVSYSIVHTVWIDNRDDMYYEVYYKRNPTANGFTGFQSEPSQGRHLVRDPLTGNLHLVLKREDNKVYYAKSTDNGASWEGLTYLGDGLYPTVGVAMTGPGYEAICVAYKRIVAGGGYKLSYRWRDPLGVWRGPVDISTSSNPGPPSLVISNTWAYVAYKSGAAVLCSRFDCSNPAGYLTEAIDNTSGPSSPCLAVDGNGAVYGAWRRSSTNQVYYAPRGSSSPYWSSKLRVDRTTDPSQQPFVECYGDSVFVAWSDGEEDPNYSDVWRVSKRLSAPAWQIRRNVSQSLNIASESPTQAWQRLITWAEGTGGGMFDTYYWRADWGARAPVVDNPAEWSYWVHSQMNYNDIIGQTELWTAWTESPNAGQPPFRVLTNHTSMPSFFGPGEQDFGPYYCVLAGLDTASVYCLKRDGVLRFADKAVDFARDSLVYELPYFDPVYDYYLKVYSYRETGENWAQGLSFNGGPMRTVQFASNRVDTIRVRIPPELYVQDRKVRFVLKNLRGDFVPALGLTLFQRDPKPRDMSGGGQGGGTQAGVPVSMPYREVFAVYPNPVKGQAQIEYSLKAPGVVSLAVYDIMGRLVQKVVDGKQPAGVHKAVWDGMDADGRLASTGIYFVRLSSPERSKTARVVVVR